MWTVDSEDLNHDTSCKISTWIGQAYDEQSMTLMYNQRTTNTPTVKAPVKHSKAAQKRDERTQTRRQFHVKKLCSTGVGRAGHRNVKNETQATWLINMPLQLIQKFMSACTDRVSKLINSVNSRKFTTTLHSGNGDLCTHSKWCISVQCMLDDCYMLN